jgi:hypothetical protein
VITSITTAELAQLTGEVLPERAVLSTVAPTNFGGGSEAEAKAFAGGGDHHTSTTIGYACQTVNNPGSPGSILSATAGTGPIPGTISQSCVPAAIVNNG